MKAIINTLWALSFWLFIAVKVAGTAFALWSWWWVLFPVAPALSFVLTALHVAF